MTVIDASALLAFVQGEPGADVVEQALGADAMCGAANWSEVAPKVLAAGRNWDLVALADRVDTDVLTADTAWGAEGRVRQIR